jgi:hypothetical protein
MKTAAEKHRQAPTYSFFEIEMAQMKHYWRDNII